MDGLHRSDDIHFAKASRVIRMHHLHMFNTMPEGRQVVFLFISTQLLVRVKDLMIGTIADGVDRHPKAYLCGFTPVFEQLLAVHVEDAAILVFTNIRLEHRSSVRTEGTIHKRFDRAYPPPVLTE